MLTPTRRPSPNFGYRDRFGASGGRGTRGRHGHRVSAIVFHVFGGDFTAKTQQWFFRDGTPASYNDLILRNGEWLEIVSPDDSAWANGAVNRPLWLGVKRTPAGRIINPNLYTHSICREGHNHQITSAQEEMLFAVARIRAQQHGLPLQPASFIGHNELDSVNRAFCPGLGFNWTKFHLAIVPVVPNRRTYTIQPRDTLWQVAQRHGVRFEDLIRANSQITDPSRIVVGQVITIP